MEQPLMNILDQCIDRIRAGEPVEACLNDYPEYADELRDMLHIGMTLGELVTAAPAVSATQDRLQQRLADRIDNRENHMQIRTREKRKRRTFGMMSLGAAAVLALIMGVGIGVFATMSAFNPAALAPVVAEPTEPTQQLTFSHNPALFSIPREGDTPLYFEVDIVSFGEASEYVRIAAPAELGITDMEPVSLQGWTLSTQDELIYTFGDEHMYSSGIQVHSRYGYEHYGNVYIGHTEPIWRLGDKLILRDANNEVLLEAAVRDVLPSSISTAYDNTVMIYSEALYTDMFDPGILTQPPIYVDVINPGTDSEHIRIENWLNVQDFDLSGWTLSSDTGVSYTLPNVEWYQPLGASRRLNIYTLPKATSTGKYHIGLPEPVWQSAHTLTLTRPDGLSGTLALNGADTPQSPLYDAEYIRPVYRYNDVAGIFMVVADGQPTAIFQLQIMNPGYREYEYIHIFAPANVSMANVRPLALDGWTLSDDDGNIFTFDGSSLPSSGLSIYTRDGADTYGAVYMGRDSAMWDEDDTLTLANGEGDIVLQANIGTLSFTVDQPQALRNSIYFEDPDNAPAGLLPPYQLNVDVIFPGQEGENVRITSQYGSTTPDLTGWTISDDDGHSYRIPYQDNADAPRYLSFYTESGTDEPGKYYMDFDAPIWQLDDTLTITRPEDGATYNIIVEESIEMPWHLGNPPE